MKLDFRTSLKATLVIAAATFSSPALALGIQAPELGVDPGPGFPEAIAPPAQNGGGNGGGGNGLGPINASPVAGADNRGSGSGYNSCPNGELVVSYELDEDGNLIGSTFSRECVLFQ